MLIPSKEFISGAMPHQLKFLKDFEASGKRFFMVNWHRRARKTTTVLNLLIREAMKNPNSMYLYVGPTYKQAKSIIWLDPNMLKKWCPFDDIVDKKNEQELYIKLINGSYIQIKGADKPDSLRGGDAQGIVLDEWAVYDKPEAWTEIFRPIIAQRPDRWAIFIFTPKGQNHCFDMWQYAQDSEQWHVSLLDAEYSGIFDKAELGRIKHEIPASSYDQEYRCSFLADEEFTLITSKMLDNLKNKNIYLPYKKRLIACDPAFGGDECVSYAFNNTEVIDELILHTRDEDKVYGQLAMFANKHKIDNFVVDSIGIGHGVAYQLKKTGFNVIRFNSSEKSKDENRFANKKAEAWWRAYELVNRQEVTYPKCLELRKQLSSVRYKPEGIGGRIALVPKTQTKKILLRSPDRADAWVMGLWALDLIDREKDSYLFKDQNVSDYAFNAMTC